MRYIETENPMVIDSLWPQNKKVCFEEEEESKKPGYEEAGTGIFVPEEDAYDYALERCLRGTEEDQREFKEMLVEWFYSGNWSKEG